MKIREEGVGISETGTWNQANIFSYEMIMKLIENNGVYLRIARTGFVGINARKDWDGTPIDDLRLEGFRWLINNLIDLIGNSKFSMKKKDTSENMEKHKEKLIKIKNIIPTLYKIIRKRDTKITKINEEIYNKVLDMVSEIRDDINISLNKNNLIFIDKESIDSRVYEKKIMHDLAHRG